MSKMYNHVQAMQDYANMINMLTDDEQKMFVYAASVMAMNALQNDILKQIPDIEFRQSIIKLVNDYNKTVWSK